MLCGGLAVVADVDFKDDYARLGMESRSILKSIQTEESKLSQASNITRSDLHYFRARHNYYRLSLLRLPSDERSILEPSLLRFFERILTFERMEGELPDRAPPFLQKLEKPDILRSTPSTSTISPALGMDTRPGPTTSVSSALMDEVLSQLQLVRLALTGDSSPESKKILCEGVDRIIARIKTQR